MILGSIEYDVLSMNLEYSGVAVVRRWWVSSLTGQTFVACGGGGNKRLVTKTGFRDMEEFNVGNVIKCHKEGMQFQFFRQHMNCENGTLVW